MSTAIGNCSVVVLAAGGSSRLGSPKQLLEYNGERLVQRAARTALSAGLGRVYVVVGSNADKVREELNIPELHVLENKDWEEGMASSIRAGLQAAVADDAGTDGLMVMVCDQPYLEAEILGRLLAIQRSSGMPAVASQYGDRAGTPALFHRSLFPRLMELKGDTGARKLIAELGNQVSLMPFEKGIVDIDTKEDYRKLINK